MLKVDVRIEGEATVVTLEGMLDASTAEQFKETANEIPENAEKIIVDMQKLRYTSSAGLRVILGLQSTVDKSGGKLVFTNVNSIIQETFDDTGFSDFLTIE
ncbi:MAG: STAS domain-containing protein [Lachnospiraceae bacterium]|nr:STAS domain-containing protein [Lachnospiraceae bacterium]